MKDKIFMVAFVLVLGSVLTTALIAVDGYTAPYIEKNAEVKLKSSILKALEIFPAAESEEMEELFDENIAIEQKAETTFYVSEQGDIAFRFAGSGLWGPITGILALRPDLVSMDQIREGPKAIDNPWHSSESFFGNRVTVFHRFHRFSASGSTGKPSAATAQKGTGIIAAVAKETVAFLEDFAGWPELPKIGPVSA